MSTNSNQIQGRISEEPTQDRSTTQLAHMLSHDQKQKMFDTVIENAKAATKPDKLRGDN